VYLLTVLLHSAPLAVRNAKQGAMRPPNVEP
jgi:hypothetical protein